MNKLKWAENYQYLFQNQETEKLLQNPLLCKDVWHMVDDLGLEVPKHQSRWTLNFEPLSQEWLKILAKLYILIKSKLLNSNTISGHLGTLKRFSLFLKKQSIDSPNQIGSEIWEMFDYYLRSQSISERTIAIHYTYLASFCNTCRLEGWLDINTYWFKGKRLGSQPKNDEIDYIPEEIWNQLQENIHLLPEQLQRMVLVIRTMGLRVGELLNLPLDCLRKRNNQWRLRLKETEKYQIEDELPIEVPELVTIIQEQQNYIKKFFGNKYKQLFCSNKGNSIKKRGEWEFSKPIAKVMYLGTFNRWLNCLSIKCNICTRNGELWHFTSHQFRRTVATVMTNAGVRDLIIQKYLRHRSPDMQRYYKHLLKQVLGDEYQELIKTKKYVDITGKVVASHKPKNVVTELLRRKMYQITTQYGECHRPILKEDCPTVNACWRCKEWRVSNDDLPYLKEDLQRVQDELKIAQNLGMIRQQQGLEDDRNSLQNCIKALEDNNDKN